MYPVMALVPSPVPLTPGGASYDDFSLADVVHLLKATAYLVTADLTKSLQSLHSIKASVFKTTVQYMTGITT